MGPVWLGQLGLVNLTWLGQLGLVTLSDLVARDTEIETIGNVFIKLPISLTGR